jgi:hypothetical protein
MQISPNNKSETGWPHLSTSLQNILTLLQLHSRRSCKKPSILDTLAPFSISGLSIKAEQELGLLVTYTKFQLPTRRNHRVTVLVKVSLA